MNLLVTAGPTREPLDPVRFLSNRSSGKMGYAVAAEAAARGHRVRLISGPVALPPVAGVETIRVETALDMLAAVQAQGPWYEVLVMTAAVADWRPADVAARKLKKGQAPDTIRLVANPDILASLKDEKGRRIHVGFAAETDNLLEHAERKLREKGLDMIVANDVSAPDSGFEVDTNRAVFLTDSGSQALPLMTKRALAARIMDWIEARTPDRKSP
jgi:phosphopantothenoylcysteine decarboxylase/phosphopantothenate--cysteine ligase